MLSVSAFVTTLLWIPIRLSVPLAGYVQSRAFLIEMATLVFFF